VRFFFAERKASQGQKISPRTNTWMYYGRAMQEQLPRHGDTEKRLKKE
jgi:hypothetical protein